VPERPRRQLPCPRAGAQARPGVARRAGPQVATTVPALEDRPAVPPHEHRQARLAVGNEPLQERGRRRFTVDGGGGAGEKEKRKGKHGRIISFLVVESGERTTSAS